MASRYENTALYRQQRLAWQMWLLSVFSPTANNCLPLKIIDLRGQTLHLHPLRAVYWQEARALLLADLHLGKATHFRRAGIAVPAAVNTTDFDRLAQLLNDFNPLRVLLLGDLFHSRYNQVWERFVNFTEQHAAIRFELVPGNHDILSRQQYEQARLHLHPAEWVEGPFHFSHHPLAPEAQTDDCYNLAGHVHPCVRLHGPGGQNLRLPCFYFGRQGGILPAFGAFTGCAEVEVRAGDRVYVLTDSSVLAVD